MHARHSRTVATLAVSVIVSLMGALLLLAAPANAAAPSSSGPGPPSSAGGRPSSRARTQASRNGRESAVAAGDQEDVDTKAGRSGAGDRGSVVGGTTPRVLEAPDLLVGKRAAAAHGKAGARWLSQADRRPGRAYRIQLQP